MAIPASRVASLLNMPVNDVTSALSKARKKAQKKPAPIMGDSAPRDEASGPDEDSSPEDDINEAR